MDELIRTALLGVRIIPAGNLRQGPETRASARRLSRLRARRATRQATPASQGPMVSRLRIDSALRTSTRNVAWKASSASCGSGSGFDKGPGPSVRAARPGFGRPPGRRPRDRSENNPGAGRQTSTRVCRRSTTYPVPAKELAFSQVPSSRLAPVDRDSIVPLPPLRECRQPSDPHTELRKSRRLALCAIGPSCPGRKSLFHVRIAFQPGLIEVQQLPRVFERDLAGTDGALDVLPHAGDQLVGRVLHVMQHFADRVSLDDVVEIDSRRFRRG